MQQASKALWPTGFARIPEGDPWVTSPVEELARKYNAVKNHGWYRNLDPTLDEMQALVRDGDVVVDYSAGTGILVEHFLKRAPELRAGYLLVDASPKFLRLALDKLGSDERTAYRWLRFIKEEKRLEMLDEVLPEPIKSGGVNVLCSTNAIHLYFDLPDTLASWGRVLKPGATVLVQSGNIENPAAPEGSWIIDTTVERIQPIAREIVATEAKYERFRLGLDDAERTAAYDKLRQKFFLPVRPLGYYVDALSDAGFERVSVTEKPIEADVADWTDFLNAYHEGVLGWAGGSKRIDGEDPSTKAVALRQELLRDSLNQLFEGQPSFQACWTYLKCHQPAG